MSVHKKSLFLVTGCLLGLFGDFLFTMSKIFSHSHFCLASCTFKVSNTPDVLLHYFHLLGCYLSFPAQPGVLDYRFFLQYTIPTNRFHFPVKQTLYSCSSLLCHAFFPSWVQMLPMFCVSISFTDYQWRTERGFGGV